MSFRLKSSATFIGCHVASVLLGAVAAAALLTAGRPAAADEHMVLVDKVAVPAAPKIALRLCAWYGPRSVRYHLRGQLPSPPEWSVHDAPDHTRSARTAWLVRR